MRRSAMAPIAAPSRNNGTQRPVRKPRRRAYSLVIGNSFAELWISAIWTVCLSRIARPTTDPRTSGIEFDLRDRTMMGDEEELVAIGPPNGRRRTPRTAALRSDIRRRARIERRPTSARRCQEFLAGRRLLLQRLSKVLLRRAEFAGKSTDLLLQLGKAGTGWARTRLARCCAWASSCWRTAFSLVYGS